MLSAQEKRKRAVWLHLKLLFAKESGDKKEIVKEIGRLLTLVSPLNFHDATALFESPNYPYIIELLNAAIYNPIVLQFIIKYCPPIPPTLKSDALSAALSNIAVNIKEIYSKNEELCDDSRFFRSLEKKLFDAGKLSVRLGAKTLLEGKSLSERIVQEPVLKPRANSSNNSARKLSAFFVGNTRVDEAVVLIDEILQAESEFSKEAVKDCFSGTQFAPRIISLLIAAHKQSKADVVKFILENARTIIETDDSAGTLAAALNAFIEFKDAIEKKYSAECQASPYFQSLKNQLSLRSLGQKPENSLLTQMHALLIGDQKINALQAYKNAWLKAYQVLFIAGKNPGKWPNLENDVESLENLINETLFGYDVYEKEKDIKKTIDFAIRERLKVKRKIEFGQILLFGLNFGEPETFDSMADFIDKNYDLIEFSKFSKFSIPDKYPLFHAKILENLLKIPADDSSKIARKIQKFLKESGILKALILYALDAIKKNGEMADHNHQRYIKAQCALLCTTDFPFLETLGKDSLQFLLFYFNIYTASNAMAILKESARELSIKLPPGFSENSSFTASLFEQIHIDYKSYLVSLRDEDLVAIWNKIRSGKLQSPASLWPESLTPENMQLLGKIINQTLSVYLFHNQHDIKGILDFAITEFLKNINSPSLFSRIIFYGIDIAPKEIFVKVFDLLKRQPNLILFDKDFEIPDNYYLRPDTESFVRLELLHARAAQEKQSVALNNFLKTSGLSRLYFLYAIKHSEYIHLNNIKEIRQLLNAGDLEYLKKLSQEKIKSIRDFSIKSNNIELESLCEELFSSQSFFKNKKDLTIHIAVNNDKVDIIKNAKKEINARNSAEQTPLVYALSKIKSDETIKALLSNHYIEISVDDIKEINKISGALDRLINLAYQCENANSYPLKILSQYDLILIILKAPELHKDSNRVNEAIDILDVELRRFFNSPSELIKKYQLIKEFINKNKFPLNWVSYQKVYNLEIEIADMLKNDRDLKYILNIFTIFFNDNDNKILMQIPIPIPFDEGVERRDDKTYTLFQYVCFWGFEEFAEKLLERCIFRNSNHIKILLKGLVSARSFTIKVGEKPVKQEVIITLIINKLIEQVSEPDFIEVFLETVGSVDRLTFADIESVLEKILDSHYSDLTKHDKNSNILVNYFFKNNVSMLSKLLPEGSLRLQKSIDLLIPLKSFDFIKSFLNNFDLDDNDKVKPESFNNYSSAELNILMFYAIEKNRFNFVNILMQVPDFKFEKNNEGHTPYDFAVKYNKTEIAKSIQAFQEKNSNIVIRSFKSLLGSSSMDDPQGNSELHYYVVKENITSIHEIEKGDKRLEKKNRSNNTPLALALSIKPINEELIKALLQKMSLAQFKNHIRDYSKLDFNHKDLIKPAYAVRTDNPDIYEILLNAYPLDVINTLITDSIILNKETKALGFTPLMLALQAVSNIDDVRGDIKSLMIAEILAAPSSEAPKNYKFKDKTRNVRPDIFTPVYNDLRIELPGISFDALKQKDDGFDEKDIVALKFYFTYLKDDQVVECFNNENLCQTISIYMDGELAKILVKRDLIDKIKLTLVPDLLVYRQDLKLSSILSFADYWTAFGEEDKYKKYFLSKEFFNDPKNKKAAQIDLHTDTINMYFKQADENIIMSMFEILGNDDIDLLASVSDPILRLLDKLITTSPNAPLASEIITKIKAFSKEPARMDYFLRSLQINCSKKTISTLLSLLDQHKLNSFSINKNIIHPSSKEIFPAYEVAIEEIKPEFFTFLLTTFPIDVNQKVDGKSIYDLCVKSENEELINLCNKHTKTTLVDSVKERITATLSGPDKVLTEELVFYCKSRNVPNVQRMLTRNVDPNLALVEILKTDLQDPGQKIILKLLLQHPRTKLTKKQVSESSESKLKILAECAGEASTKNDQAIQFLLCDDSNIASVAIAYAQPTDIKSALNHLSPIEYEKYEDNLHDYLLQHKQNFDRIGLGEMLEKHLSNRLPMGKVNPKRLNLTAADITLLYDIEPAFKQIVNFELTRNISANYPNMDDDALCSALCNNILSLFMINDNTRDVVKGYVKEWRNENTIYQFLNKSPEQLKKIIYEMLQQDKTGNSVLELAILAFRGNWNPLVSAILKATIVNFCLHESPVTAYEKFLSLLQAKVQDSNQDLMQWEANLIAENLIKLAKSFPKHSLQALCQPNGSAIKEKNTQEQLDFYIENLVDDQIKAFLQGEGKIPLNDFVFFENICLFSSLPLVKRVMESCDSNFLMKNHPNILDKIFEEIEYTLESFDKLEKYQDADLKTRSEYRLYEIADYLMEMGFKFTEKSDLKDIDRVEFKEFFKNFQKVKIKELAVQLLQTECRKPNTKEDTKLGNKTLLEHALDLDDQVSKDLLISKRAKPNFVVRKAQKIISGYNLEESKFLSRYCQDADVKKVLHILDFNPDPDFNEGEPLLYTLQQETINEEILLALFKNNAKLKLEHIKKVQNPENIFVLIKIACTVIGKNKQPFDIIKKELSLTPCDIALLHDEDQLLQSIIDLQYVPKRKKESIEDLAKRLLSKTIAGKTEFFEKFKACVEKVINESEESGSDYNSKNDEFSDEREGFSSSASDDPDTDSVNSKASITPVLDGKKSHFFADDSSLPPNEDDEIPPDEPTSLDPLGAPLSAFSKSGGVPVFSDTVQDDSPPKGTRRITQTQQDDSFRFLFGEEKTDSDDKHGAGNSPTLGSTGNSLAIATSTQATAPSFEDRPADSSDKKKSEHTGTASNRVDVLFGKAKPDIQSGNTPNARAVSGKIETLGHARLSQTSGMMQDDKQRTEEPTDSFDPLGVQTSAFSTPVDSASKTPVFSETSSLDTSKTQSEPVQKQKNPLGFLFGEEESDSDDKHVTGNSSTLGSTGSLVTVTSTPETTASFEEEEGEDLSTGRPAERIVSGISDVSSDKKTSKPTETTGPSLFDQDEENEEDLFSKSAPVAIPAVAAVSEEDSKPVAPVKKDVTDQDLDDLDIFVVEKKSPLVKQGNKATTSSSASTPKVIQDSAGTLGASNDLTQDSDEFDESIKELERQANASVKKLKNPKKTNAALPVIVSSPQPTEFSEDDSRHEGSSTTPTEHKGDEVADNPQPEQFSDQNETPGLAAEPPHDSIPGESGPHETSTSEDQPPKTQQDDAPLSATTPFVLPKPKLGKLDKKDEMGLPDTNPGKLAAHAGNSKLPDADVSASKEIAVKPALSSTSQLDETSSSVPGRRLKANKKKKLGLDHVTPAEQKQSAQFVSEKFDAPLPFAKHEEVQKQEEIENPFVQTSFKAIIKAVIRKPKRASDSSLDVKREALQDAKNEYKKAQQYKHTQILKASKEGKNSIGDDVTTSVQAAYMDRLKAERAVVIQLIKNSLEKNTSEDFTLYLTKMRLKGIHLWLRRVILDCQLDDKSSSIDDLNKVVTLLVQTKAEDWPDIFRLYGNTWAARVKMLIDAENYHEAEKEVISALYVLEEIVHADYTRGSMYYKNNPSLVEYVAEYKVNQLLDLITITHNQCPTLTQMEKKALTGAANILRNSELSHEARLAQLNANLTIIHKVNQGVLGWIRGIIDFIKGAKSFGVFRKEVETLIKKAPNNPIDEAPRPVAVETHKRNCRAEEEAQKQALHKPARTALIVTL